MRNMIYKLLLITVLLFLYGCNNTASPEQSTTSTTSTQNSTTTKEASKTQEETTTEVNSVIRLGNTSGNISNGGFFCGYDGYIYYRSEKEFWALTKAKFDGSERTKISDDIPSSISVVDDWIYYSNYSDGHRLYKIKTDGTGRTKLTDCIVKSINVINDVIYFINWDNPNEDHVNILTRINTDGSDQTVLSDMSFSSIVTDGEYLYGLIAKGNSIFPIFKLDLDGTIISQINTDEYTHFVSISGDYIFYWSVDENKLKRIDKDGSNNIVLSTSGVDYVNSNEEHVYYIDPANKYNVYMAELDGKSPVKISSVKKDEPNQPSYSPAFIHVIEGYVFYRAYYSEEAGDALFVIKPGKTEQEVWEK